MDRLGAFFLTCLLIELSPGPNTTYLAGLALAEGRKAGLAALVGASLGLFAVGSLAVLGLAKLIVRSPAAFETLRVAGILYLFWLAFDAWRGSRMPAVPVAGRETTHGKAYVGYVARGFLSNVLNPKAAMFYLAVIPAFVQRDWHPHIVQNAVLAGIYVGVATAMHFAVVFSAARIGSFLVTPHQARRVRQGLALMLVLVAVWFAWETRG